MYHARSFRPANKTEAGSVIIHMAKTLTISAVVLYHEIVRFQTISYRNGRLYRVFSDIDVMNATSLVETHASLKEHILSRLSSYGLTHRQPRIMYYIAKHEGCRQGDIARHCHVETATLSTVLSNMEKRGLIERRRSDTDRRAYSIHSKEEARPVFDEVIREFEETERIAFEGFSEEEKKEMIGYLKRVEQNIRGSKENRLQ